MSNWIKRRIGKIQRRLHSGRECTLAQRYPQYQIGRGTYGDLSVSAFGSAATLRIGNFTSIAAGVRVFLGGEHRLDWVTTFPFSALWESAGCYTGHPRTKGDVIIGADVWIGAEALITSGVTIGDGAVIGARAVVSRDVAPYTVVAGNPAAVVKVRFDEQTVKRLLALKWWDWSDSEIERALPELLNNHIKAFLEKAEAGAYRTSQPSTA
ncbi:CatB-related O-acetyltransferase [uncultured Thiodictyon sp.]|uniref:CatB-related O-acetyltransferase n=1 Tax=uncultured Thiodictyon sp. TaxID=1846217 RepID=UPI0025E4E299|nr:CatB-related O-acetyltransferase [uncultured Thiodictyon sp.]